MSTNASSLNKSLRLAIEMLLTRVFVESLMSKYACVDKSFLVPMNCFT